MKRSTAFETSNDNGVGRGQLTLVEHALCPLDSRLSLVENLVHEATYFFMDAHRRWRKSTAKITCPLGLSANDEYYLWGLLALTLAEPEPDDELHASPHFCLRRLGLIDAHHSRGGQQYRQFADAVERLSLVRYRNDFFFDPVRGEHRKVSFGFFSYSLPLDPESSRAWQIVWDPIFFEFVKAVRGSLRFDLDTYRQLDPACRRLFLLLAKIFYRRQVTPSFELRHLAVDVLGFSTSLAQREMKRKVHRCVSRLCALGIVAEPAELFRKRRPGEYVIAMTRGMYFGKERSKMSQTQSSETPLTEPLLKIGFDEPGIRRLVRKYPAQMLRQWTDITLAALERNGVGFFKKCPQAYLLDNLRNAHSGVRTPPDWWLEMRKEEHQFRRAKVQQSQNGAKAQPELARDILRRILPS